MSDSAPAPPQPAAKGWSALWRNGLFAQFTLLMLGVWLNAADTLVTVTVMPSVVADIGGYAFFGWATGAFLLGAVCAGAASGVGTRRFGLRTAMAVAGGAYALGCAADALAGTMPLFLVGRLIQGCGAGGIIGLAFVAVGAVFPESLWARVFSAVTGVWGVATLLGPLVGGLFAGAGPSQWRGAFWFFAVQGVVFLLAALRLLPGAPAAVEDARGPPLTQLGLIAAGVTALAGAGVVGSAPLALLLTVGGVGLMVLAVIADGRSTRPMLPKDSRRLDRASGAGFLTIFLLQAAVISWSVYGGAFLQAVDEVTPLVSGYVVGFEALGWTLCALAISGVDDRGQALFIRLGPLLVCAGLGLLILTIGRRDLVWPAAASALIGAGFGAFWSFLNRKILASLPPAERSLGSSAIPTVQLIGNAAGAAGASALADAIGFDRGITRAAAAHQGPLLFLALSPLALAAVPLAFKVSGFGSPPGSDADAMIGPPAAGD